MPSPWTSSPASIICVGADALGGQRVAQRELLGRGVAEPESALHRAVEAAVGEIAARVGAGGSLRLRSKRSRGEREHLVQARALLLAAPASALSRRGIEARHRRRAARPPPGS